MSRIRKAYETRFAALLRSVGARRREQGLRWLNTRTRELSQRDGLAEMDAMARLCERLAALPVYARRKPRHPPAGFYCDAGLGGLARWLRAAGHIAHWEPQIEDDELLRRARDTGTTILTTDSMLMERRLLRESILPAFWLPPAQGIAAQLAMVFREFHLRVGESRCMSCGGQLRAGDKEALKERIPPRTYRWLDSFFTCGECGKLFWHGTHWEKIRRSLETLAAREDSACGE